MEYLGNNLITINGNLIEEKCETEYKEFKKYLEEKSLDIDYLAKYISSHFDEYEYSILFEEYIDEPEEKEVKKTIMELYNNLVIHFLKKTGMTISLYSPLADVVDEDMDCAIWIVKNYFIVNPSIDQTLLNKTQSLSIVQTV